MKRLLKRLVLTSAMVVMMVMLMASQVFGAASVTISGGDNVKGGDTFYVAVTFGGGEVGRVDAQMAYDTNKLTYISGGTSTGNAGYINLSKAGTDGSITFNIKFQALTDGSAELSLTTLNLYNLDEMPMNEYPSASKTINISGNAQEEQIVTQETSPEAPVEPETLAGVDVREDEGSGVGSVATVILIVSAVILIILIIIISIILAKKKKGKAPVSAKSRVAHEADDYYDYRQSRQQPQRSNQPQPQNVESYQEPHQKNDAYWMDDLMGSGNMDRQNDHRKTYRKRAKEETELFDDWDLNYKDDDGDDIEKW